MLQALCNHYLLRRHRRPPDSTHPDSVPNRTSNVEFYSDPRAFYGALTRFAKNYSGKPTRTRTDFRSEGCAVSLRHPRWYQNTRSQYLISYIHVDMCVETTYL